MKDSPLLLAAFQPAKKVKKGPKKVKMGESMSAHTQVGEQAAEIKEPTPMQRMKNHAREEKIHATRKWIAGEMTTSQHNGVHARANKVLKGKFGKKMV